MGSIEPPTNAENGSLTFTAAVTGGAAPLSESTGAPAAENDVAKKRKASMLPLEVGTRVLCRWRDNKYHPVKVIERRKLPGSGANDYEYYVHYTECM